MKVEIGIVAFLILIVLEVAEAAIGLIGKMSQREIARPMALNIHSLMKMVSGSNKFFRNFTEKTKFYGSRFTDTCTKRLSRT